MKKVLSLVLSFVMLISITAGIDLSAYAMSSSGQCGENVTWDFNSKTGELTISGTGDMYNYDSNEKSPFYNDNSIKSIVIENGIKSVGDCTFSGCSSLTSVTISDSVTRIGNSAFSSCTSLTSVTVPDSVTNVGIDAFENCSNLKKVNISSIEAWCGISFSNSNSNPLYYANNLYLNDELVADLTIPDSVTNIGNYAFGFCSSITSVTIPNSVTSIGVDAFENCSNLKKVNISSIETWCDISFSNSNSNPSYCAKNLYLNNELVADLTIPDSVTNIGNYAFGFCSSIISVTIPNSVTSIGVDAFENCSNLKKVNISSIETWCDISFSNSNSNPLCCAKNLYLNNELVADLVIPDSVTNIGKYAFRFCSSFTSVTIPDSVTSIDIEAFKNCSRLSSVTIGNNLTGIGVDAFENCTGLKKVNISSIEAWCDIAFSNSNSNPLYYAKNLYLNDELVADLVIPDSVTNIGKYAFRFCSSFTSVTIPDSVKSIDVDAFENCSNLKKVNVSSIEAWCDISFSNSNSNPLYCARNLYLNDELITDLVIPDSVTKIGNYVFRYCSSFTSVTIPNSVISIGVDVFENCSNLASVTIGNNLTSIGVEAFEKCTNLQKVNISSIEAWCNIDFKMGDPYIAYSNPLYYAKKLYLNNELVTDLVIPDNVTSIGKYAFAKCTSLTNVTIPDSVTSIGNDSFSECSNLKSVTIGKGVTDIGYYAFYWCKNLADVNYAGSKEDWDNIFIKTGNNYLTNANINYNYIPPCEICVPAKATKENITEATCTSDGSYDSVVYCSVCKRELSREYVTVPMTPHSYTESTTAPTCDKKGFTTHTCSNCGDTYIDNYVDALGHNYKNITTKATTSADGKIVKKCSVCGKIASTTVIPKASSITISSSKYTYDGNYKKPTVIVKDSKGNKLSTANYSFAYSNNKYVGKASVKITLKGNYSGTKTLYFTINPKGTTISSLTETSRGFKVTWKKQATQTTGYQIQYSTSSKFSNAKTVTVTKNSTTSKSITNLTAKKKYYVRVRTYKTVNGTKYYSAWSGYKTVATKK